MMLSNHGVDSDAHEAGARHAGRYAPPTLGPRMVIDRLQYILSYV